MFGYGYGYRWGFDWTYLLLIAGLILSLLASAKLKSTFSVYKRLRSASGLTGAQTAQRILRAAGIFDVQVVPVQGSLTDHYDPVKKVVRLSQDVYNQTSLAAVGVRTRNPACQKLCSFEYPKRYRAGGEHWSEYFLAAVYPGADLFHSAADHTGDPFVFSGCPFSACDSACGGKCFFQGSAHAGNYRDFKPQRKQRGKKSFNSRGPYLCGCPCFLHPAAFEISDTCRRTQT